MENSYRQILKSSAIIGSASFINIILGIVRTKILAIFLGPSGVGLVGLYTGLIAVASTLSTMGLGTAGTRQIAEASRLESNRELAIIRRSLFLGTLFLSSFGGLAVWGMRDLLAIYVLGSSDNASIVGWLSIGVALSVAGVAQGALIQGMRRITDMASLSVYGAVLNLIFGLALIWKWGTSGLVAFVLTGPIIGFLLGHWFVLRLPALSSRGISLQEIAQQWKKLLKIGVPFMGAALVGAFVQLCIRTKVGESLGFVSLGYFQSSWSISIQYIGFILAAMTADFYPRLCGVINDQEAASRLINEQTEIALLLCGPIFISMIGLTHWVILLLYSPEFLPAMNVLRWQILADVMKVAAWPLGYALAAIGASKTFFFVDSLVSLMIGMIIYVCISYIGLPITGIAFLIGYATYLPLLYFLVNRKLEIKYKSHVILLFLAILMACILVAILSLNYWWGSRLAIIIAFGFLSYTFSRLWALGKFRRMTSI
jgi:O-antigen/teichoic acid export membrane protein